MKHTFGENIRIDGTPVFRMPTFARVVCLLLVSLSAFAESVAFTPTSDAIVKQRFAGLVKGNQERGEAIRRLFQEAGCAGESLVQEKPKGPRANVVCTLPGETADEIIVGAHFDKVHAGEGAIDNWSGASLLPSLYETVRAVPKRRFTWVFIAFAEEETGLRGSTEYVKAAGKERMAKVHAMINMDCLGMTNPKVWYSRSDKRLTGAILSLAHALGVELGAVDVDQVGDSDSHPFQSRKVPVLDIHSLTPKSLPLLHSRHDVASAVDPKALYDTYKLIGATLVYLDGHFDRYPDSGRRP